MGDFAIVVLAAGGATRMGRPKQLLDFDGMPLVCHAANEALASGCCSPVVVVCGAHNMEIAEALSGMPVQIAVNHGWEQGMGSSIQAGLRQLEQSGVEGIILSLADQPLVDRTTYRRLLGIHQETRQPIVASEYCGTVGVPVLFTRAFFPHLLALAPSQGCKGVIQGNSQQVARFDCPDGAADVDTPADYDRVLAEFVRRRALEQHLTA